MNFGRVFASAVVRRFAYVLVALVLGWIGIGKAHAQSAIPACAGPAQGCTIERAFAVASDGAALCASYNNYNFLKWERAAYQDGSYIYSQPTCQAPSGSGSMAFRFYAYFVSGCAAGEVFNPGYGDCQKSCTSVSRPPSTVPRSPLTGSLGCNTGCVVNYANNGDDTSTVTVTGAMCGPDFKTKCPVGTFWNGMMGLCQPFEPTCPQGQVKKEGVCVPDGQCPKGMVAVQGTTPGAVQQGELYCKAEANECPAGMIKAPATGQCIPGDGQCAVGEARGKDGTCKKDTNGDGKPDEEEGPEDPNKDSAAGGDTCDAPPSCSGNAIQCMQVKIQWRIDCNTRRQVNIAGGTCDAVPVCTGKGCNAMEYAQLLQQWRTTCAVEKLASKGNGEPGTDGTDANGNGVPDALEGAVGSAGAGETPNVTKFGAGFSTSVIDRENIFGSGSCPQPPSFQLMGQTISGADFPYWCQAMAILRSLILIFGAFTALKILMGGIG